MMTRINHFFFTPFAATAAAAAVAVARRGPADAKVLTPSASIMTPKPSLSVSSGTCLMCGRLIVGE